MNDSKDSSLKSKVSEITVTAPPAIDPLPKGAINYMTPAGAKRLREELHMVTDSVRPKLLEVIAWAASNGDRSENGDYIYGKRRLRELDRRILYLNKRIDALEVVNPLDNEGATVVRFGASVDLRSDVSENKSYTIVGVDETDIARGRISWISPIGKALLQKQLGNFVEIKTPGGSIEYEITRIRYFEID